MGFVKYASVESIGVGSFSPEGGGLKKIASDEAASPSFYLDGARKLDIRGSLQKAAEKYDISPDPEDYIFEAIRANTTNVPNENFDAFQKSELLRYDTRLAMPVYMTYVGKPHHLNHKADNPKRARGVILDSHYNDDSPALENCPTCHSRTAELTNRDPSGIHCASCGDVVKDEFVEILVAVDTRKDPALARGVQAGILNAGSMGCFLPGTPITLDDGTRIPIEDVRPGDRVITHSGAIAEVGETSVHEHEDNVFKIFVQGHQEPVVATGNHPFWVVDPETGEGSWVDAEKLELGQYLRCPATNQEETQVENDFARLVGFFISEGNYTKAYDGPHKGKRVGLEFSFSIEEDHYVDEVVSLLRKYGNDPSVYTRPSRNLKIVKDYRCIDLTERMFELVGQHAVDKTLSSEVMAWPREAQLHLIGTWLNGDGYSIHDKSHSWSGITTASVNLRDQLSQMLVNLGIPHRHRYQPSSFGGRIASEIIISGNPQLELKPYSDKVKRPHGIVSKVATLSDEKGLLRKIKSIETGSYEGPVYNFEVDHDDHSYVAGGVAVHNCNCASTECNVCGHIAHTVRDFCQHIRGGNKGTLWKRSKKDGGEFKKITADEVAKTLKRAGWGVRGLDDEDGCKLVSVALVNPEEDFEIRRAHENCLGVEYEEYSRVYKPADPKARTREILKAAGVNPSDPLSLEQESELLILKARLAQMEARVSKTAQSEQSNPTLHYAVRVNENDEDIHWGASVAEALKKAEIGKRDKAEIAASLTSRQKISQWLPLEGDVSLVIPDGAKVHVDQGAGLPGEEEEQPTSPEELPPGSEAVQPETQSIEDLTQQEMNPEQMEQSPEEFGMLPPGASAETEAEVQDNLGGSMGMKQSKFADVYGDFEVEVFDNKAILHAPGGEIFRLNASKKLSTVESKRAFGREVIDSVLEKGLVRTAKKYDAAFSKAAMDGILEGAMFDVDGGRPTSGGGVLADADDDLAEARRSETDTVLGDEWTDGAEDHKAPKNTLESRDTDMQEGDTSPASQRVTDKSDDDMKDSRPEYSGKTDTLDGAEFDMKAKKASEDKDEKKKEEEKEEEKPDFLKGKKDARAPRRSEDAKRVESRLKKIYASRLERAKADFEAEKEALEKTLVDRFARALKIAAKRQTLNLEISPLKATLIDSLTVPRPVGKSASTGEPIEWLGLDETLALHLVEAAWDQSGAEEVDQLVRRASELLEYDEKYMLSAESDLAKAASVVPQVILDSQVTPTPEPDSRAGDMRRQASEGNLVLAPSEAEDSRGSTRVDQIRSALGTTKVGRLFEGVYQN